MITFITIVIGILALVGSAAVLLQPSKDTGLGGLSGSGADTVLGTGGNALLAKVTWWILALFIILCLVLGRLVANEAQREREEVNKKSVFEEVNTGKDGTPGAAPAAAPAVIPEVTATPEQPSAVPAAAP